MAESYGDKRPTVLLLGGSQDQLFAIHTARKMGLRALVVDQNAAAAGATVADEFFPISTRNVQALKNVCDASNRRGHPVQGVMVMGSDIPYVVAELCEYLNTPGITRETARLATHKYDMKVRFSERNIPLPWFSIVHDARHLRKIVAEHGYPLVLKPVDRSGARGVFRLTEGSDLDTLYNTSRQLAFSGEVMVEECLEGLQISTETIMWQGRAHTLGFADRNYEMINRYAPNIIENGGTVPTVLCSADRKAVESLVERAALALGVTDGVAKGDVVFTPEGPKMIEMAARLSGGDFSESLIPLGCGVNIVETALSIAIGSTPDLSKIEPRLNKAVVNRYFFPSPGRLIDISGAKTVKKQAWVKKLEFWYAPGDIVPEVKSHADRFGVFVLTGETIEEVNARSAWVYDQVKITTARA